MSGSECSWVYSILVFLIDHCHFLDTGISFILFVVVFFSSIRPLLFFFLWVSRSSQFQSKSRLPDIQCPRPNPAHPDHIPPQNDMKLKNHYCSSQWAELSFSYPNFMMNSLPDRTVDLWRPSMFCHNSHIAPCPHSGAWTGADPPLLALVSVSCPVLERYDALDDLEIIPVWRDICVRTSILLYRISSQTIRVWIRISVGSHNIMNGTYKGSTNSQVPHCAKQYD